MPDGDFGTTADRGFLVFERAYNTTGPVAEDTWVHNEILDFRGILGTAFMWLTNPGNPAGTIEEVYNRDLEDWVTTANPNSLYPTLGANTVVTGISIGIGSGWTGDFQGAIDNVTIGFNGEETTWNFEPPTATGQPDIVTDFVSGSDKLSLVGVLDGFNSGSDIGTSCPPGRRAATSSFWSTRMAAAATSCRSPAYRTWRRSTSTPTSSSADGFAGGAAPPELNASGQVGGCRPALLLCA